MKNKAVVISISILVLISALITVPGQTGATVSGDYEYLLINDNSAAEITSYTGTGGAVIIPSTMDGYPVLSIGSYAFQSTTALTGVTIPAGVTSISNGAFYNCTSLASVTLPDGLTTIGSGAFYNCHSLTSIVLPSSLVTINGYAFYSTGLTAIAVPDNVADIGDGAFRDCHDLASVTLPHGLDYIGSGEFANCSHLASITIPEGVMVVGEGAFTDCISLTSIDIPDNVTLIGESAFQDCIALSTVTLGSNITSIDSAAFFNCSSLTSLILPDNVTEVGFAAFSGCTALSSLKIGSSVIGISALTFYDCRSLTSVDIPDSVGFIGYGAFFKCTSLASVVIGSGVMDIGLSAFESCTSLTSMTFKSNQPALANSWIASHGSSLIIRYYNGASGFTTPSWEGIPTEMQTRLAAPQNINAVSGTGSVSLSWSDLSGSGSEGIDYYIIYQNGVEVMHAASGNEVNISGLANGRSYTFKVAAHDASGPGLNSSTVTAQPNFDPNGMVVNITSPQDNAMLSIGNVDVIWTVNTAASDIVSIDLKIDDDPTIELPANATRYSINGLVDGIHTVNVTAFDGQGGSYFDSVFFTVDLSPPTVELRSPTGDGVSTRVNLVITFSELMDQSVTDIILVGITGSTGWDGKVATFVPASTLLGNTAYEVQLTGIDLSGNALTPISWTFTTGNVGTISGKITDDGGRAVANATVTLTNATANGSGIITKTDGSGNYAFYDVSPGNYTVTVTKDGYGMTTSNVEMTSAGITTGGVTSSAVIHLRNSINDMLPLIGIVSGGAVIAALLAFVLVRKKHKKD